MFGVAVEAIGKSFRIRAESTDGSKLSCKKSLRTYRVVRAKLHVENIEGIVSIWEKNGKISSYFYTKPLRNCITVDVSIRDKNGNVLDLNNSLQGISRANMMSCSTACEDVDITMMKSGQQVSPIDGRWCRMQFRMEPKKEESKKQVPLPGVVVRIKSQYADVGYTVLQPIKVRSRKKPSPPSKKRTHSVELSDFDFYWGVIYFLYPFDEDEPTVETETNGTYVTIHSPSDPRMKRARL